MSNEDTASPTVTQSKLKVGLIVDSEFASKYVYELAEWGQARDNLSISHLIIQKAENAGRETPAKARGSSWGNGFINSIRLRSFALITKFEQFRIRGNQHYKDHLKRINLKSIVTESITITLIASKDGLSYQYSAEDIQNITDLDLDVLVHCGSGILGGDILKSPRFGIISVFPADDRITRGGPAGFWEVYSKEDNTGFTIQQLAETPHDGNVLVRGRFRTRAYFLLNQAALNTKSNFYLKELLNDMASTQALPAAVDSQPYFNPFLGAPDLVEQLKYISYCGFATAVNAINRILLKRDYRFGVAYMNSDWKTLVMSRAKKIQNPRNHYLADPFVISEGNRSYCFVEDYDYKTSRGCIGVYELKDKSAERLGDAIVEPFHMSFPYLFRFDSKLYMCPESSENRDIRVYECVKFPLQWKLSKILMSNISAVDAMMFERDGLWWLFTNIDRTNTGNHESELFIFYSDNPLEGEWHSHTNNPVLIDSAKGRNGGILFDDKWIYRVSQKQGYNLYGKGLSINKISVLNKNEYVETELCSVEPKFFPGLAGCHHLHSNGNTSVFDFLALRGTR